MIWLVFQAAALAVVFTQGAIFDKLRAKGPEWWTDFLGCPLCIGVWTGMAGALLEGSVLRTPPHLAVWGTVSIGAISGCVAWGYVALLERLGGE